MIHLSAHAAVEYQNTNVLLFSSNASLNASTGVHQGRGKAIKDSTVYDTKVLVLSSPLIH